MQAVAEFHLLKTLTKTKSIASSPSFPAFIEPQIEKFKQSQEPAYVNVTARLYNSNPVKTAIAQALSVWRNLLGVALPQTSSRKTHGLLQDTKETPEISLPNKRSSSQLSLPHGDQPGNSPRPPEKQVNFENPDIPDKRDAGTNEDESNPDLEQYEGRLAGNSSNELEDEISQDSFEDSRTRLLKPSSDNYTARSFSASPSLSPSPSLSGSSSADASRPFNVKHERKAEARANSTKFLPSLTLGGYWSGSGSEAEDDPDAADIQPRKNRMGQQARRQLWEKKFGDKANHVKTPSRSQGWDARKGAQEESGSRGRESALPKESRRRERWQGDNRKSRRAAGGCSTGANSDPVKTRPATSGIGQVQARSGSIGSGVVGSGPLHPSWIAAKNAKEQKKVNAPFEGKKIKFS